MKPLNGLFLLLSLSFSPISAEALEWLPTASNTKEILTDLAFPDSSTGYACGSFGTLLKTTDGGRHWSPLKSPSNVSFTAIAAIDGQRVFCGRRGLYRSEDGGQHWTEVEAFSEGGASIFDIEFVSATTGFLIKSGFIYKSTDAGLTWKSVFTEDNEYFLDRLYQPKDHVIIATGGFTRSEFFGFTSVGFVLRSDDNGETWNLLDTTGIPEIMAADWQSSERGMLFTHPGTVFQTLDGGAHWFELDTNLHTLGQPLITAARFVNENLGYAVSFDGKMLRTEDGGLHWQLESEARSKETGIPLVAMALLNQETVLAAGNEGLIYIRQGADIREPLRIDTVRFLPREGLLSLQVTTSLPDTKGSYRIESSTDLRGPWTVETVTSPRESPWTVQMDTRGKAAQFYRLAPESALQDDPVVLGQ